MKFITNIDENGVAICKYRDTGKAWINTVKCAPVGDEVVGRMQPYIEGKPFDLVAAAEQPKQDVLMFDVDGNPHVVERAPLSKHLPLIISTGLAEDILDSTVESQQAAWNDAVMNSMEYGDLLLFVSAFEGKETAVMIYTVYRRLFSLIMDLYKSAKRLNVVATYDLLANLWLEMRYGWRPFIGELESLYKLLTEEKPLLVNSSYGGRKTSLSGLTSRPYVYIGNDNRTYTYEVQLPAQKEVALKVGFNYVNSENSRNDSLFAKLGLDAESLLTTAWDLVPFSFILDMFLNISDILKTPSQTDQVNTFNEYISHKGHLSNVVLHCVSVDGFSVEKIPPYVPDINFEQEFTICKYQTSSYFSDTVADNLRFPEVSKSNQDDEFIPVSLIEKALGTRVLLMNSQPDEDGNNQLAWDVNYVYAWYDPTLQIPRLLEGKLCNGQVADPDDNKQWVRYQSDVGRYLTVGGKSYLYDCYKQGVPLIDYFQELLVPYRNDGLLEARSMVNKFYTKLDRSRVAKFEQALQAQIDLQNSNLPQEGLNNLEWVIQLEKDFYPFRIGRDFNTGDGDPTMELFVIDWLDNVYLPGVFFVEGDGSELVPNGELDFYVEDFQLVNRSIKRPTQVDWVFEATTDLNPAQVVDVALIGERLVTKRLKYKRHF